jgi:hypothetical protein
MANYSQSKYKNTKFGGTDSIIVPTGTTGERSGTELGQVRYNTDLGFLEQYNASGWAGIDAPPTVSNSSGVINEDTNTTITVTGSNFKSGSIVYIEGAAVSNSSRALSTTFVNSGELSANTNAASVNFVGGASYNIKVVNPSGLSAVLEPAGTIDRDPIWNTAAGLLATVYDVGRANASLSVSATDPDGASVTYSLAGGALPTGLSLNTSTGALQGTISAVGSDTTYSFTIRATGDQSQFLDRSFTVDVKAPVVQTFSYTGSTTSYTVPSAVTDVQIKAWGAGGGREQANGGAGGFSTSIFRKSAGSSHTFAIQVGQGGNGTGSDACGGGGYSGVFVNNSVSFGNSLVIAGGGGGGNSNEGGREGGAGGGTNGQDAGSASNRGEGGTQTAGGLNEGGVIRNDAGGANPIASGQLQGGWGGGDNKYDYTNAFPNGGRSAGSGGTNGAGGGSGYYGGGGGTHYPSGTNSGGGGGGSGYVHAITSGSGTRGVWTNVSGASYTGNRQTPATQATSDSDYPGGGIANGATADLSNGSNGYLVIRY